MRTMGSARSQRFEQCLHIEQQSMNLLLPNLMRLYPHLLFVARGFDMQNRSRSYEHQKRGDILIHASDGRWGNEPATLEVKAERRFTGNLFLEQWSDYGRREGWLHTSKADFICFIFLEPNPLAYLFRMERLRQWYEQNKHSLTSVCLRTAYQEKQRNDTRGSLAPIRRLRADFIEQGWKGTTIELVAGHAIAWKNQPAIR